ncbi:hypothetical protein BO86DRAFT_391024 [Aspergillus japonicus CBS 114.51]|uniref:Uncharacterized protein n=1 Tax=Aspergillus japonicus CBS 114.51 TaxID=1448312 RepID=A0A8T8WUX4_ASPJA|nr:hypothetical protein BO86DRAFT_391024 [Aspergillus japonicus CBS 114.51]RAH79460.1 hypothetical protein BO86DRAFT_391024 [Aspergillus japonicus CBS 114.51]
MMACCVAFPASPLPSSHVQCTVSVSLDLDDAAGYKAEDLTPSHHESKGTVPPSGEGLRSSSVTLRCITWTGKRKPRFEIRLFWNTLPIFVYREKHVWTVWNIVQS